MIYLNYLDVDDRSSRLFEGNDAPLQGMSCDDPTRFGPSGRKWPDAEMFRRGNIDVGVVPFVRTRYDNR